MTFSILARDPRNGHLGAAIASRFFAVGALCPHVRGGVGAFSTQALLNPLYGERGLRYLGEGRDAAAAIALLVADDAGRDHRQVHAVDVAGRAAAHTGSACVPWCGWRSGEGVSVAGNMLAGPQVLEAMLRTFDALEGVALGLRLLKALKAGEEAGGDKRGKQSAALRVHRAERYPALDIRADDHAEPIDELFRLYEVAHQRFLAFAQAFPTREDPVGTTDRARIEANIERWLKARADAGGPGRI
ncbi:MAG TPA: DUF1028 domain-containing protein [Burkholderiales bacterium]|nr:DUF1028 domain-containing protein [Burkholderiales bacterium]